ncbi:hypothetical protein [Brevibacterium sp. FME37]|uniref:hypothetical protein n=1 Tax=Brevibacterium sp. FME37 TaxID=2742607 RepID=UPI001868A669|nr:hypothetical protein [Brevibacterium sp. FME37]
MDSSPNAADWLSAIGTISAAIIALGLALLGLWREHLSRAMKEAEAKREMARVYCWAERAEASEGHSLVFVKNETDYPVHGLVYQTTTDAALGWDRLGRSQGGTLSIPPRAVVTERLKFGVPAENVYVSMAFTDASGYAWTRHWNGQLTPGLVAPDDRIKPLHITDGQTAE